MKKFAALILALILALAAALPAQAEESWYEITDGVLTIRLDTAPGCSWDFMIDDLYYLDVVTFEYLGDEPGEVEEGAPIQFVGSFTNFSGESGSTTLNLVYSNENSEEITFFAII